MNGTFASDCDLHALVDGQIDPERRIQTLRHLAGAAEDRARVKSWQTQNELLQRAFAGIDLEPLPILLDLKSKPKLQCVPANDSVRPLEQRPARSGRSVLIGACIAAAIGGAAVAARYLDVGEVVKPDSALVATETALSDRASAAVAATRDTGLPVERALPTTHIPDLRRLGFSFVGATTIDDDPGSIQFAYKGGDDAIVVSVARASQGDRRPDRPAAQSPQALGQAFVWRRGDLVYALSGSPRAGRLRSLALAIQTRDDL